MHLLEFNLHVGAFLDLELGFIAVSDIQGVFAGGQQPLIIVMIHIADISASCVVDLAL